MSERAVETKVGFFLLVGLATIATMIIIYGRFEETFQPTYTVTVKFLNAEGLLKGTTVTLAGSPIGRIKNHPAPIEDDGETKVAVELRINKSIQIRENARFRIVSIGMLGDRGIDVLPQRTRKGEKNLYKVLEDGAVSDGESPGGGLEDLSEGFMDLKSSAKPALDQIHDAAEQIKILAAKTNSDVMTPETTDDLREAAKKLRSVLTRLDALLAEAQQGKGTLARILNDPKMADDLTSFISNLRHKGVLFYSDQASDAKDEALSKEKGKSKP